MPYGNASSGCDPGLPTLGIYAVPDRGEYKWPGFTHDHSLCLMQGGKIQTYLHLERYSRRKYDNRLHLYLDELAPLLNLPERFDVVSVNSFVGTAFLSPTGRYWFDSATPTRPVAGLRAGMGHWNGQQAYFHGIDHELAHVFSVMPFFPTLHERTLLVHFDGGATHGNFSAFMYQGGKLNKLECHWELSRLSKWFNDNALTFKMLGAEPGEHCSVPGKLMGYAAFGTPSPEIAAWLVENDYFRNIWTDSSPFFRSARRRFEFAETFLDLRNEFVQNVAATFQWMFENEATKKILELQAKTGAEYLYYAGGCALNIVTNTKIVESGAFRDVFIPPCCNDSGLSVGAAAFVEWRKHGKLSEHGPFLNNFGTSENAVEPETVRAAAETILAGGVVGVCNGAGEAGPRALGNRSLLARADDPALAFKLSVECKKREWYRPVAPVALLRNAPRFTEENVLHSLARYMLLDYRVPEKKRDGIRGAVHVNGTARMQTLENREENPFIYELLSFLEERGVYALINTSFNAAGEPIVHTPEQALASMRSMRLDGLVLHQRWIK